MILDAVTEYAVREIAQRCTGAVVIITTPAPVTDVQRLLDVRVRAARIGAGGIEAIPEV